MEGVEPPSLGYEGFPPHPHSPPHSIPYPTVSPYVDRTYSAQNPSLFPMWLPGLSIAKPPSDCPVQFLTNGQGFLLAQVSPV